MTKRSVLMVWLIVTGATYALDPEYDEVRSYNITKPNNEPSRNETVSSNTTNKTPKSADSPRTSFTTGEEKSSKQFRPTISPTSEELKGRSLFDYASDERTKNTTERFTEMVSDLSNLDMDDDGFEMTNSRTGFINGSCYIDGIIYVDGETLVEDCDSMCTCYGGMMMCDNRCSPPFVKKGKEIDDANCTLEESKDVCCAKVTCNDTETPNTCLYQGKKYTRGERISRDCNQTCYCSHTGERKCVDRCPKTNKPPSDRCLQAPDPKDSCCMKTFCDVGEDDHKILTAKYVNGTGIKIEFLNTSHVSDSRPMIQLSSDNKTWHNYIVPADDYIPNVDKTNKYIRVEDDATALEIENVPLPENLVKHRCTYKGKQYKYKEEFPDDCDSFCVCRENGVQCFKYECPTYSGIDILDSTCVHWETVPANFTPTPPNCCPEKLKCKSRGECEYEGGMYPNWQEIPSNVTGCEKRCYCEMGKVECQDVCPPVVATPPNTLPCLPQQATLKHPPGEDCCLDWVCESVNTISGFPNNYFGGFSGIHQQSDEVIIHTLEPVDIHTVKMVFDIPNIIVGLYGRAEVRYTDKENSDPESWSLQVFAPPNDLLATPQFEFQLTNLVPDTEYKVQITVTLRDIHNKHMSKIYTVRTPKDLPSTIDPELRVVEVNSSWATIQWRSFTLDELELIDGIQLRYKELDGIIYQATPFIHRLVTNYTLENLKYKTNYVVNITLIPFQGQTMELRSSQVVNFTTRGQIDSYNFHVTLEITQVKATSIEIEWKGVPYPEDKYVNIYRTIYQSETGRDNNSTFKIAKRGSASKTWIMDLKPGTRYKLWLQIYLRNGKTMTSNVQDFTTKPGYAAVLGASSHDKLSGDISDDRGGDYYGPLVIVAILATIAILSTLVLLLILIKRHSQNKASITQPPNRISQSAYDNPTYKVEIQQETMNL